MNQRKSKPLQYYLDFNFLMSEFKLFWIVQAFILIEVWRLI